MLAFAVVMIWSQLQSISADGNHEILYHNMTASYGQWQTSGAAKVETSTSKCLGAPCARLEAAPSSITYIGRAGQGLSTISYHNISLAFSIQVSNLEPNEYCNVSYSVDNRSSWINMASYNEGHNDITLTPLLFFGVDADNAEGVSIRFELDAYQDPFFGSEDFCYIDDVYVFGTPITADPTNGPILAPTLPPSSSPVTLATAAPTKREHGDTTVALAPTKLEQDDSKEHKVDDDTTTTALSGHNSDTSSEDNIPAHAVFFNANWYLVVIVSALICIACVMIIVYCLRSSRRQFQVGSSQPDDVHEGEDVYVALTDVAPPRPQVAYTPPEPASNSASLQVQTNEMRMMMQFAAASPTITPAGDARYLHQSYGEQNSVVLHEAPQYAGHSLPQNNLNKQSSFTENDEDEDMYGSDHELYLSEKKESRTSRGGDTALGDDEEEETNDGSVPQPQQVDQTDQQSDDDDEDDEDFDAMYSKNAKTPAQN